MYGAHFTIEEICLWYYFQIEKGPAFGYCKEKDRTGYDLLELRYVKGAYRQKCTVRCREHIAHKVMLFSSAKVENVPDQESIAESKGTDTWAEGHNISVQVWRFVIIVLIEGDDDGKSGHAFDLPRRRYKPRTFALPKDVDDVEECQAHFKKVLCPDVDTVRREFRDLRSIVDDPSKDLSHNGEQRNAAMIVPRACLGHLR